MPLCPNCRANINTLEQFEQRINTSTLKLTDGKLTSLDQKSEIEESWYACPECGWVIAEDEETAIKFLKGEEI